MTTFAIDSSPITPAFERACDRLDAIHAADRLWQQSLDLWPAEPAAQRSIANRLGWLRALEAVEPELPRLEALARRVRHDGYERVVLMGMGGSSLAPEVLHRVVGIAQGFPRFVMVDTVNPDAVGAVFSDPARTLFIVASKSGSTIEPTVLAAEARRVALARGRWGQDVIAVTDRDTVLHRLALAEGYRDVFVNPTDIGGRFSALSLFGMVPAATMGAHIPTLLASAADMAQACRTPAARGNPGLALGALMAAACQAGRDKLTLLLPASVDAFGLWIEQLVAESTGKSGTGVVPVTGEPADAVYGADRLFVVVTCAGVGPDPVTVARARASGGPLVSIDLAAEHDVAGEFMRWEVATAIAGLLLGVNPFDEPNVQQAKTATTAVLDTFRSTGRLPWPPPHATLPEAHLTLSAALAAPSPPARPWRALLDGVAPSDYLGLLVYAPPGDHVFASAVQRARARLGAVSRLPTTSGFGPRYLHSTGQLHKGGPNSGVFVIVAATSSMDVAVPGEAFSFGTLEAAQALGDFHALDAGGRRVAFVRLDRRDPLLLDQVVDAMTATV